MSERCGWPWAAASFNPMPPHTPKDDDVRLSEPRNREPKQLNLNTIIGLLLGALIVFIIGKLDSMNTTTLETKGDVRLLNADISTVKTQIGTLVTKGEMSTELLKRDQEIHALTDRISDLERRQKP